MKSRTAFRLAWGVCALTLALILAVGAFSLLNPGRLDDLSFSIVGVTGAIVGGVVASRRPANVVGWLFLFAALISTLEGLATEYAIYGILTDPGALPAAWAVAWLSNAVEFVGPVLTFILVPLYFPTGRPVSPRWGLITRLAVGMLPVGILMSAFASGELVPGTGIENPLVIESLGPVRRALDPFIYAWYIGLIFASAASLLVRFWRSAGVERQQIKWFTFAAAFIPVWFMTNRPVEAAFPVLFQLMDALVIAAVPVAAGVAIMRYRLYDIDAIINRTIVYASLTAMLVLAYLGSIVTLQYVLQGLIGEESPLAVVASTLAIAALFNPLRRGVQAFVDRRFYRSKYDAAKTLEAYAARLRDETDLEELSDDLLEVVGETVRPAYVSLWLRPTGGHRPTDKRER